MKIFLVLFAAYSSIVLAKEKIYKHSEDGAPHSLDPVKASSTYANMLVTAIYDTLFEYKLFKRPFELKPNLAESMPKISANGLVYTITIKKGVRFADDPVFPGGKGREVVSGDVIYSLKRHFNPKSISSGKWLWQERIVGLDAWGQAGANYNTHVSGLKALDKYTVQITLKQPFPQFLYTLAMGFSAVLPKEAVDKYGPRLSRHPVGSGPFLLESFNSKKAVLKKNPQYRTETFSLKDHGPGMIGELKFAEGKRIPMLDRVEVYFMKQESARWNSFTKGSEINYTWVPDLHVNRVLEKKNPITLKSEFAKKYNMRVLREFGFVYFAFNWEDPDFGFHKDPKENARRKSLRCAIRKGFDWKQRISRMYLGIGDPFPGIIPPGIDGYDPKLSHESVTHDLKGAKKLLKDGGWTAKNLPPITLSGVASVKNTQLYEQFRGFLQKIGYPKQKIKLKSFATFGDYFKAIKQKKLQTIQLAWALDYPDAENVLQLFYSPNQSPGSNSSNYKNPAFDALYKKFSVMQQSPERTALYQKANKLLVEDCIAISGFSRTRIHLWHKNIKMQPYRDVVGNYFKYVDVK